MRKFPVFRQFDFKDCGPTCLQMISRHYGRVHSLKHLRALSFITREGASMLGISDAAESIGFRTLGVRLNLEQLEKQAPLPCIAHWNQNHFVVIYKISYQNSLLSFLGKSKKTTWIHVADPANGIIKYNIDEFKHSWVSTKKDGKDTGHCLLMEPTPKFYELKEENIDHKQWKNLLPYLKPYKSLVIQLALSFIIASLLQLLFPFLTQSIVDKGIHYKDISFLVLVLIAQLSLTIGATSIDFIRGWILLYLSSRISISLLSDFINKLMRLPISFFEAKMTGDILQRMGDTGRVEQFLTSTSISFLFSSTNFIVFGFIIAVYDFHIFGIFMIGSILYVLWVSFFLKFRRGLDNRRFAQASNHQNNIIQLIAGMQEIKLNNCERTKRWEWERIRALLYKISVKSLMLGQYQQGGALFINSIKNFVITFFTAKSVIDGQMTIGMMLAVQYIIGQLNSPLEQFIGFIQSWQDAKISLERMSEIQERDTEDPDDPLKIVDLPMDKSITIKNLSFQYEGPRSPFVLKKINLEIPANKITAIVGTSGSGKTTLLKMLLGFYLPVSGEIRVGNIPLNNINNRVWRSYTGSVMQDGFLFSDSIANNIALNDEVIDKKKLYNAANLANIRKFIESLPLGYNTKIGMEGHGISQGQRQRILIARAIYKNPEFIFFDEATNALDANNEKKIIQNLNKFFYKKTVVVVAHRLSTVKNADNIVVLENGEIREQGKHSELARLNGPYYHLVKNQLELGR